MMGASVRRRALTATLWFVFFALPIAGFPNTLPVSSGLFCQEILSQSLSTETFSSDWPAEARSEFLQQKFSEAGIEIDAYSMVRNQLTLEEAQQIIAPDFSQVRHRMRAALSEGKKILLLNGSFDLVHAGHAGMIQASLHNFLVTENLKRDEVFLVVLADADSLIFSSKKHKWNQFGGTELLPRPLQSLGNIPGSTYALHPRALDLANLGADLVGLTPSPGEFLEISDQLWVQHFLFTEKEAQWLEKKAEVLATENYTSGQLAELDVVFSTAIRILNALRANNGSAIVSDFESAAPGQALPLWHVSSWQMVLQYALQLQDFPKGSVHKVLNLRDGEYLHNVNTWSKSSGQTVHYIDGTDVFYSTTQLLKTFPMQDLITQKAQNYPN